MSAEWPLEELANIATEVTVGYVGPMASEYVESGIPFLRSMNIERFQVNQRDIKYINPEFHAKLKKSSLKPNDVAIVRTGKPGTCAVIPKWLQDANCSDLVIVRCGERIRPKFLCYWINSVASHHIDSHTVGAVQQHFNVGAAKKMKVAVPALSEQDKVIEILGSIDDRIALLRETNATLEAIAQALFKSWFVDFDPVHANVGTRPATLPADLQTLFPSTFTDTPQGPVPAGWSVEPLSDVMDFKEGPGIRNWQYTNSDEGTRFINIRCIQDGDLTIETANRISDEEANGKYAHFHLAPWDVVVSTSGTLGRSAIVREEHLPLMLNTSVIRFRPVVGRTVFSFLYQYLNGSEFLYKLESMASGSVQKNFGPMHLKQIQLVCPPFTVQQAYEGLCRPLYEKIVANRAQAQTLAALRDTLLPRLISGQLRLPDAEAALAKVNA